MPSVYLTCLVGSSGAKRVSAADWVANVVTGQPPALLDAQSSVQCSSLRLPDRRRRPATEVRFAGVLTTKDELGVQGRVAGSELQHGVLPDPGLAEPER